MPLRWIGGLTRFQLPNEAGNAPSRLIGTANFDDLAVTIDAAGEGAVVTFFVPHQWSRIGHLYLIFGNLGLAGIYNFTYTVGFARCSAMATGGPTDSQISLAFMSMDCRVFDLTPYVTQRPGDMIIVTVVYRAAGGGGLATNLNFFGAYATEA